MSRRLRFRFAHLAVLGVLAAALGLTGCGRKGPLDPPPSAALTQPAQTEAPGPGLGVNSATRSAPKGPRAFDASGRPIAPKGEKKALPADWLID